MKLFRSVDDRLADLGFEKTYEGRFGATYERVDKEMNFTHVVDIRHKDSGRHIIQSYDKALCDSCNIGNTCVGLSHEELKLFRRKFRTMERKWRLPDS